MNVLKFDVKKDFSYHWCGTFIAPNEDWIHLSRNLTDYELIVVTEGILEGELVNCVNEPQRQRDVLVHPKQNLVARGLYIILSHIVSPFSKSDSV